MLNALDEYLHPKIEYIIIRIDWIGRSDHSATILNDSTPTACAYFLKHPHARPYCKNEIVFDYIFDDIFKVIKEGRTYKCKLVNGKIIEMIKIQKTHLTHNFPNFIL
jgi:hypothetical protein